MARARFTMMIVNGDAMVLCYLISNQMLIINRALKNRVLSRGLSDLSAQYLTDNKGR